MFEGDPVAGADEANVQMGRAQRRFLSAIAEIDRDELWRDQGARDTAHWISMRYGISGWRARRWIAAAHALERLPALGSALEDGRIGIDKIVELARFATLEDERDLIAWAGKVSCYTVRRQADLREGEASDEVTAAEEQRYLEWWYHDEGRRFSIQGELPGPDGALVERALERLARRVSEMPGEKGEAFIAARRADALVALASAKIAADPDPDRATVIVHTSPDRPMAEIENGPVMARSTAERWICSSRVQNVLEDAGGEVLALGQAARIAPAWMLRQVRYRDRGCTFPGCGTNAFTEAHHVRFWRHGGRTTLSNLALVCSFHHRLVHEHGWTIERGRDGDLEWLRPDGTPHRAGPPPRAPTLEDTG
jgi:uncharacterized protein DUF222/HNH endonuclease